MNSSQPTDSSDSSTAVPSFAMNSARDRATLRCRSRPVEVRLKLHPEPAHPGFRQFPVESKRREGEAIGATDKFWWLFHARTGSHNAGHQSSLAFYWRNRAGWCEGSHFLPLLFTFYFPLSTFTHHPRDPRIPQRLPHRSGHPVGRSWPERIPAAERVHRRWCHRRVAAARQS